MTQLLKVFRFYNEQLGGRWCVLYPSPFNLLHCRLRSLTPITYYFVGSRGFAYLSPSSG
ncbi:MAG: hypothetical protein QS721_05860 [Candidatus Endonucleobacter sp. (ex Gigantidas childressi)]|nr:hypothetical protein [Candidatus Endonucleobacter sp. (ex Gigantidas childressi)]